MKIDIHTHLLPAELPRFAERYGYGGFITLEHHQPCRARMMRDDGKFFREIESNCWDPARRLAECDAAGVSVQVLSTVPVMFSYWAKPEHGLDLSRFLNDHLASVVRTNPRRFAGLGTVPLQDVPRAIGELERCVRELGLAGVQIGSHVNGTNLGDASLFPFFEAAAALGAAVFVHPWDMLGGARLEKYWLPWLVGMPAEVAIALSTLIFSGTLERLPTLRLAFAHGGGSFPGTIGRLQHGFEARPDLVAVDNPVPPRDYLGRFWVDSLVHDADVLRLILRLLGPEKVALGSDYPFPLGEERPGTLLESLTELDAATRERLLWRNALEWLGRTREDFGS
ncbi:aminocarboxymuconate-semialdehyde decarboxylase [Stigmatella aurantiaca]|uniref:2-amino-3-carboxymuconate-6-semialdehyde decarboxylase n=1 Tax=Stigmatella aurantiaca TaxID=41 RepID=A0A1H7GX18_STIAU|nr:amidohydrolase family protein [Stigmatella aurantiaca]SEK40425.1 aminocarboxymuconate-semialdehyde decarboxylase [Stigmatella aurantiaca]